MAELDSGGGGGKKKGKKVRSKKMSTRIDLTPMVDLGFLLITFFMLTTTLSKPKTMEINMPVKPKDTDVQQAVKESQTLTLILSKNSRVFYYMGITDPKVEYTNFSANGIRKILKEKDAKVRSEGKDGLIVLIKADDEAKYKNMVDILDEMKITEIKRYAIVDISPVELDLIKDL